MTRSVYQDRHNFRKTVASGVAGDHDFREVVPIKERSAELTGQTSFIASA
jgi:hypothetical protein